MIIAKVRLLSRPIHPDVIIYPICGFQSARIDPISHRTDAILKITVLPKISLAHPPIKLPIYIYFNIILLKL
jgi:hypothetical protein